ncbi:MAG: hypothetical protein LKJ25_08790 [Clostridia bacterium]|jgi:hypothetical protein|nr:hypothetical protein [Clostridia bacterium]
MPDTGEEEKGYLKTDTEDLKFVSDYTGLDFNRCLEIDCYTFKLLLRDAFIYKMRQTESGRGYLEDCYLLTQTKPDKKRLRQMFKGCDSK